MKASTYRVTLYYRWIYIYICGCELRERCAWRSGFSLLRWLGCNASSLLLIFVHVSLDVHPNKFDVQALCCVCFLHRDVQLKHDAAHQDNWVCWVMNVWRSKSPDGKLPSMTADEIYKKGVDDALDYVTYFEKTGHLPDKDQTAGVCKGHLVKKMRDDAKK